MTANNGGDFSPWYKKKYKGIVIKIRLAIKISNENLVLTTEGLPVEEKISASDYCKNSERTMSSPLLLPTTTFI